MKGVQESICIEIWLAEEQPRATLDLALRHVWVETCPCMHITAIERSFAFRMLQVNDFDVTLRQPCLLESLQQEEVRISPPGGRDSLSCKV
jgi:hypothetical protein